MLINRREKVHAISNTDAAKRYIHAIASFYFPYIANSVPFATPNPSTAAGKYGRPGTPDISLLIYVHLPFSPKTSAAKNNLSDRHTADRIPSASSAPADKPCRKANPRPQAWWNSWHRTPPGHRNDATDASQAR